MYHLRVTVTLTFDLVLRKLCPEHISYIIEGRNPNFGVWMSHVPFLGHFDLDL